MQPSAFMSVYQSNFPELLTTKFCEFIITINKNVMGVMILIRFPLRVAFPGIENYLLMLMK